MFKDSDIAYMIYTHFTAPEQRASNCAECGECEEHCPQHLDIREELKLRDPLPPLARKMQNARAGVGYLCQREQSISEHETYGHGSEHPQVQQQKTQVYSGPGEKSAEASPSAAYSLYLALRTLDRHG